MLITKTVKLKWCSNNKKYYTNLGYKFTKMFNEFEVNVEDLKLTQNASIEYYCDYCLEEGKETIVSSTWDRYNNKKGSKDCCRHCSGKNRKDMGILNYKELLTKEQIIEQYNYLKNKIGKVPSMKDIQKERNINSNFMTIVDINKVFGGMIGLRKEIEVGTYNHYDKDVLINILKDYCKKNPIPKSGKEITKNKELPTFGIFKRVLGIKDIIELYEVCEIEFSKELTYEIKKQNFSKEEVINIIYSMISKLNRPLMYDDFRNPKFGEVGIAIIKKYWKNMNEMKKELGLTIVQEDMNSKHIDENKMQEEIKNMCEKVYKNENRKLISYKDINEKNGCSVKSGAYNRYMKNPPLRGLISSLGFELLKEGNGLNHTFEDGERVRSSYEYDFSKTLKDLGLVYGKDYFRDVRYNTFIEDYEGLLDCDYVFKLNNILYYIEIAGMLKGYEKKFKENIQINNSKSKEKYRLKLSQKEDMFLKNNLSYIILFPKDLDNFKVDDFLGLE